MCQRKLSLEIAHCVLIEIYPTFPYIFEMKIRLFKTFELGFIFSDLILEDFS